MSKKITNLISKLLKICDKQGVTLSLCAFDDDGNAKLAQCGNKPMIELAIDEQLDSLIDSMEDCGCESCKRKLPELAIKKTGTDNAHNDREEMNRILEQIMKGDFNERTRKES